MKIELTINGKTVVDTDEFDDASTELLRINKLLKQEPEVHQTGFEGVAELLHTVEYWKREAAELSALGQGLSASKYKAESSLGVITAYLNKLGAPGHSSADGRLGWLMREFGGEIRSMVAHRLAPTPRKEEH